VPRRAWQNSSDSVDWISYAEQHYGLSLTSPAGVRSIVRALDLANVELPSIRTVVEEIIVWSRMPNTATDSE
jgi:hypothetical protein